jgi:hypothetical protein
MTVLREPELFRVGRVHVTIEANLIDGETMYSALFMPDPDHDYACRFEAEDLDDLARAAAAADAIIRCLSGTTEVLDTARELARLGVVPPH